MLAGILSSLVALRFGAPLLLVFLILGMAAGEWRPRDQVRRRAHRPIWLDRWRSRSSCSTAACARALRPFAACSAPALTLATVGVLISAVLAAPVRQATLLGLGWNESLLVGAMVASTDAAAVFFLIHARGLRLRPRVGATLEVESGTNDPFAIFLT